MADIPKFDILRAGFPCQPFSIAGVSKKLSHGRKHGFDDEKQGNLFFSIADILDYHQPPAFILENVKHLQRHDQGRTFQIIMDTLQNALGYTVYHRVIDARNVRATNSLVDVCYTVDGRLGGFVNYCTKIWDIAVPALAFREAGGRFTDLDGTEIVFRPDAEPFDRNYAVVGANAALHPQILAALRGDA